MPASVATNMSDVDTSGPFPMDAQFSGGLYWGKSSMRKGSTARAWRLFGDSQGFYLFVNQDSVGAWISAAWIDIQAKRGMRIAL